MEHLKKIAKNRQFVVSALIGKERFEFLKKNNLSVAKILKEAIDNLMKIAAGCLLLSLMSCGGGSGGGTSDTAVTASNITTGNIYAKADNIRKEYSLGYDLSYSCTDDTCSFTGELHHWSIAGNYVAKAQISSASLVKSGSYYTGIIYLTSGQQFNVSINIGQNFIEMNNGVNCTRTQIATTLNGYDSYLGSVASSNANIAFNSALIGDCDL